MYNAHTVYKSVYTVGTCILYIHLYMYDIQVVTEVKIPLISFHVIIIITKYIHWTPLYIILWTPLGVGSWDRSKCPDLRGVLISEIHVVLYTYMYSTCTCTCTCN